MMAPQVAGEVMGEARSFRDHVCPVTRAFVDSRPVVGLDEAATRALVAVGGSQGDAGGDGDESQEEDDLASIHGSGMNRDQIECATSGTLLKDDRIYCQVPIVAQCLHPLKSEKYQPSGISLDWRYAASVKRRDGHNRIWHVRCNWQDGMLIELFSPKSS